jgi:hypothetical protein
VRLWGVKVKVLLTVCAQGAYTHQALGYVVAWGDLCRGSSSSAGNAGLAELLCDADQCQEFASALSHGLHSGRPQVRLTERKQLCTGVNESRTGVNESRTGVNESRTGVNESRTGVNESRTGVNESRTGVNESRTGVNESRLYSCRV